MIEMIVESMRISQTTYQRVIFLKEKNGEKCLPIWIGPAEADAIGVKMQDLDAPRPLTHDLLRIMIKELDGSIKYIVVTGLEKGTFLGKIIIKTADNTEIDIDYRPSDGIALALRANVPIYAEKLVLDMAGITLDKETGKLIADERRGTNEPRSQPKPVTPEEREGPFSDVIEGLDLSDFDEENKDGPKGPD